MKHFKENNGIYENRNQLGIAVAHMRDNGQNWTQISKAVKVSVRTVKRAYYDHTAINHVFDSEIHSGKPKSVQPPASGNKIIALLLLLLVAVIWLTIANS